jgi:PAS domain S-box-containing protein
MYAYAVSAEQAAPSVPPAPRGPQTAAADADRGAVGGTTPRDRALVAVVITDLDGVVTDWNDAATETYGWSRVEALGRTMGELASFGGAEAPRPGPDDGGSWEGELRARRRDGTTFPAYVRETVVAGAGAGAGAGGGGLGIVRISIDLTDRAESARQLRAARDYLRTVTDSMEEGLYTVDADGRMIYMNRAAERLLGWRNDELVGELAHDKLHFRRADGSSHSFADCPTFRGRRDGQVARVEDDVFVRKDGRDLPVAYTATPFQTEDGVRGSVVVFRDISARKREEHRLRARIAALSWVGRVRDALTEERLTLHAQPIVGVATGRPIRHELLLRLRERDGTIVPPDRFLPAAEEHGLIVDIDDWVVGRAIALASRGHAVQLNLSAQSVGSPGLLERFRSDLQRTGADPGLIVVELTETALLADEGAAEIFIDRLKSFGCKLALDDFGTGYGGFTYLKRLPVDFLKIDTEFVHDLSRNTASQHVVRAVVSLARGFGQQTIAEGVEHPDTLQLLAAFGVDYAQGYAIARPGPVEEMLIAPRERLP